MTVSFEERLNQILPKITSEDFLSGRGLGNEIAFFIFDYPAEEELRMRQHVTSAREMISSLSSGAQPSSDRKLTTASGR